MSTYLLRWNPDNYSEDQYIEFFRRFEASEDLAWSCGNTKAIVPGDRFFLLKSEAGAGGVIGSGVITGKPRPGPHYNPAKAAEGKTALYVAVKFDYLLKPGGVVPIRRHELDAKDLTCTAWNAQGSGKLIPEAVADALEKLWRLRAIVTDFKSADEVPEDEPDLLEGAKKRITVNAYERSLEARRKCIDRWGYNCSVCSFNFEKSYGSLGKGYIHVHHLMPLSKVKSEYKIDPVKDLRPVCPNCHAMLHRGDEVLSIEDLQDMVRTYSRT